MRSDAVLGAWVVVFVVLLTGGLRLAVQAARATRTDRSAELDSGERVRLMVEAARRGGMRAGI